MSSARTLVLLSLASCRAFPGPTTTTCLNGPCGPGNEVCGKPFGKDAPQYHLMDQHGCGENDPSGPVFDPVHGVIHHFYQIHLAAPPGRGPDYGHFVSKDFVHWAPLPVAIWNGLDSSVWPPRPTPYDNEAIYTGSAVVVDGAGPGGKGPGVIQIYPGLCNKKDWPGCETGTLLAQAVPADYAHDELLTNWSKPSYNPIVEGTQRDPSSPWKMASGEWRLRTYDSKVPHAWFGLPLRVRLRARLGASDPDHHRGPRRCTAAPRTPTCSRADGTRSARAATCAGASARPSTRFPPPRPASRRRTRRRRRARPSRRTCTRRAALATGGSSARTAAPRRASSATSRRRPGGRTPSSSGASTRATSTRPRTTPTPPRLGSGLGLGLGLGLG